MSATDTIPELSFEAALAELEKIVAQLESGDVPLERSIELYENGAKLRQHCEVRLKEARLKVDKIILGKDGQISSEPSELDNHNK